jgi:ParB family transcriptional regulator, chromosome partitioning protein
MSCETIYDVKLNDIEISDLNVRHANAQTDIDELAASIKQHGLLQPVVLLGNYGKPPYKLIAGQRRFLAHERLKARTIRAVFAGKVAEDEAILLSLIENLQSVELNHADSMKAITRLYETYDKDERRVHKETGLSLRRIRDYLTINSQASDKMKAMLRQKKVTPADVKRALRAAQGHLRKAEELLALMAAYPLTKHQKSRIVDYGESHESASPEKILEEAMRPRVEQSILVSLPEEVRKGLEKAMKSLEQEAEEIVADILQAWLAEQGFIGG